MVSSLINGFVLQLFVPLSHSFSHSLSPFTAPLKLLLYTKLGNLAVEPIKYYYWIHIVWCRWVPRITFTPMQSVSTERVYTFAQFYFCPVHTFAIQPVTLISLYFKTATSCADVWVIKPKNTSTNNLLNIIIFNDCHSCKSRNLVNKKDSCLHRNDKFYFYSLY